MPNKSEKMGNEMSDDVMDELAELEMEIQKLSKKKDKTAEDKKKLKSLEAKRDDLESMLYGDDEDESEEY